MSKKYVPSFLKEQQQSPAPTASIWPGSRNSNQPSGLAVNNRFSALSDDFPMKRKTATDMPPATLASLTSTANASVSANGGAGGKKSYAARFSEKVKVVEDPNYKPPPKQIDIKCEEDFPSLGGSKKTDNTTVKNVVVDQSKFAQLARGWAKKDEDDEEAERIRKQREEKEREENMLFSRGIRHHRRQNTDKPGWPSAEDEYDEEYYGDDALGDDDYEVPEYDDTYDQEDDENSQGSQQDDEINSNIGKTRRHNDDLY